MDVRRDPNRLLWSDASLGFFLALALAMYLTRNVDWYGLGRRPAKPRQATPEVAGNR